MVLLISCFASFIFSFTFALEFSTLLKLLYFLLQFAIVGKLDPFNQFIPIYQIVLADVVVQNSLVSLPQLLLK